MGTRNWIWRRFYGFVVLGIMISLLLYWMMPMVIVAYQAGDLLGVAGYYFMASGIASLVTWALIGRQKKKDENK